MADRLTFSLVSETKRSINTTTADYSQLCHYAGEPTTDYSQLRHCAGDPTHSSYYDADQFVQLTNGCRHHFSIPSLNIESINGSFHIK